ncbi:MAG: FADH(2)-oxidizing methylenetetrahydrofolate--tRNA-(uracil(54)-C(5))-methyltransferase TrmFO [Erysipelotrichaceae bacterium]|nr:FADH(2)-oxidizing methylenetetrahydrofolate--tRNA-(uracil(54)-C(5))-methyltransferase TrmFO [Erysipelotrichaceae bacterium]MBR3694252.1 FADH(2)-oxidizing methylenetetrahydrofolate--tRNA-(uracil(54)-C(5))-methyltransferase TrmFO [Erysipelotrichales bacterium]
MQVKVVGAGLAGCEAAWQIANRGVEVLLYEMKPLKSSPAHHSENFAELVCSNSLRSDALTNAVGVLKEEMRMLDSLIMEAADACRLPAGSALAVDRHGFSQYITDKIKSHPLITVVSEEITELPEGPTLIATGPLTSDALSKTIADFMGSEHLYFYDAAAPIIEKESIDFTKAYFKSRYDKGDSDYINCAMTKEEFEAFYRAIMEAETAPLKEFEKEVFFEGCMPFEEMARRGQQTLLFGPMKPVGLERPDGSRPYAVVQLRQDNAVGTLYNVVGFQTHLTFPNQKKILQMIPGLENCEIVRYGVMHRNTYIHSPSLLNPTYQCRKREDLFFAGQMTGVEGYVESAASGLFAGINIARYVRNMPLVELPSTCVIGSQAQYITHAQGNFQPMNANFGIMELKTHVKSKKDRKEAYGKQALEVMESYKEELKA